MFLTVYFRSLIDSLTTVRFYLRLLTTPLRFSLIFFAISCIWLGLLSAIRFNLIEIPAFNLRLNQALTELQTNYPSDLIIDWNGQHLQLQPAEAVVIPYPSSFSIDHSIFPSTLGYLSPTEIDVKNLASILPSPTFFVTTPTTLWLNESSKGWSSIPLNTLPAFDAPFVISADTLPRLVTQWQTVQTALLQFITWASVIVIPVSFLLSRLWMSVLDAFIFYFLLQLNGFRLDLKKVWQVSLHVVITASLIQAGAEWLYPQLNLPLMTIATWVLFTYLVLVLKTQIWRSLPPKTQTE